MRNVKPSSIIDMGMDLAKLSNVNIHGVTYRMIVERMVSDKITISWLSQKFGTADTMREMICERAFLRNDAEVMLKAILHNKKYLANLNEAHKVAISKYVNELLK